MSAVMPSPFGLLHVIVNPRAGGGATGRDWPGVRSFLDTKGIAYAATITDGPGHATRAAEEAIIGGCRFLAAVGGDGTINEVVNGMMDASGARAPDLVLGLVPSGTGCDAVRTFGIPQDPLLAAAHLLGDGLWGQLDVGRVRSVGPDGQQMSRWFLNIAEAGIGADVVASIASMPRWLGARAYRLAALRAITRFKPRAVQMVMHGRLAKKKVGTPLGDVRHDGQITMAVFANGQFFGGGLRVTPRAIPSDAMLDVLVGEGGKWDALRALRQMPTGTHVPHPTLTEYLADRIEIDGPVPMRLEADGELLGMTPAVIDLVPAAISLKI